MTESGHSERRRYDQENHDLLRTVNNNLHNLVSTFSEHVLEDKEKHADLEQRLRSVERDRWLILGAVAIIQFAIKYVFK